VNPRGRAALTIVAFATPALVTSALVGGLGGDGSLREWLLSIAGSLELWGVLLVASPELVPVLRRLGAALFDLWGSTKSLARRAADWALRKLGRPRKHHVSLSAAVSGGGAMSAKGTVGVREGATNEEKIEFLLQRDQATQSRLADLREELDELPRRWRADMEAKAGTLRREQQKGLARLRDEHLAARFGGVVLLVLGLGLATWGNLL
jgi:hypothetical protein